MTRPRAAPCRPSAIIGAALAGALREIALAGRGTVESYPEDTDGRTTSGGFLHNATLALFEQHGFTAAPDRQVPLGGVDARAGGGR